MNGPIISTDRLLLRPWKPEDRAPFAAMNADAAVMEHFNAPLTREESDHFADFIEDRLTDHGYGLWATERLDTGEFIGFVGLAPVPFEAHFTPAVEVGWRLALPQWGFGFASEGGAAAIEFGLQEAGLDEIVSFAVPANKRSIAVMERIGMTHDPADDFDHPSFAEGHRLRRHVLYRISS